MKKILSLIVLLLLLAACAPGTGQEDGETPTPVAAVEETTSALEVVTSTPEDTATGGAAEAETTDGRGGIEVPADAAIVFRREGGIEGLVEQWTIYQDGRVVDIEGSSFQVPAGVVEGLVATAESGGFFAMDARYMPLDTCCDRFTYWLAMRQGDEVHTVQALDAEESVPPMFWTIVAAVQSAVEAAAGQ